MFIRALAAAAVILVSAIPALAKPPPVGLSVNFAAPAIACDTEEHLGEIYAAAKDLGQNGLNASLTAQNASGFCGVVKVAGLMVAEVKRLGYAVIDVGRMEVWAIRFVSPRGEIRVMYGEKSPLPGEEA